MNFEFWKGQYSIPGHAPAIAGIQAQGWAIRRPALTAEARAALMIAVPNALLGDNSLL